MITKKKKKKIQRKHQVYIFDICRNIFCFKARRKIFPLGLFGIEGKKKIPPRQYLYEETLSVTKE